MSEEGDKLSLPLRAQMDRHDFIRELGWTKNTDTQSSDLLTRIEKIVQKAVAAEREACAKVCDEEAEKWEGNDGPICYEARLCAVNIRARGEK